MLNDERIREATERLDAGLGTIRDLIAVEVAAAESELGCNTWSIQVTREEFDWITSDDDEVDDV